MKVMIFILTFSTNLLAQNVQQQNKVLANNFYQDLWFSNNTDNYAKYMADEYIAHDIGDRKGVTEPAIEQKIIADRFWSSGILTGEIDYQIAEGDLVATRWHATFKPDSLIGRLFVMERLPIINVFRIKDGKIVELWNHRHDIDTNKTLSFTVKGVLIGLLIALIPTILWLRARKKLKALQ